MSPIGLNSLQTRMKVFSPNCYAFKKPSVLAQTIGNSHNSAYFKRRFLNNFDSCLEYKSVSYTMVYNTPCFEEVYLDIRDQSGCLLSLCNEFLKGGTLLYLILPNDCFPDDVLPTTLDSSCLFSNSSFRGVLPILPNRFLVVLRIL